MNRKEYFYDITTILISIVLAILAVLVFLKIRNSYFLTVLLIPIILAFRSKVDIACITRNGFYPSPNKLFYFGLPERFVKESDFQKKIIIFKSYEVKSGAKMSVFVDNGCFILFERYGSDIENKFDKDFFVDTEDDGTQLLGRVNIPYSIEGLEQLSQKVKSTI